MNFYFVDCPHDVNLPELPNSVSCYMLESCMAIDCCLDYSLLNISLNFDVSVDTCNYVISVRIEKLSFQLSFSNYIWRKYFKQTNSDEVSYYRKYFKHAYSEKIPLMKCIFAVIQRTLLFNCETYLPYWF